MKYHVVCVAGTFDGIHAGHEALLSKAFEVGKRVLIGLTSDGYVKKYKDVSIHGYGTRLIGLNRWLRQRGYADRAIVIPIDDPFEPAVSDPALDALVVSKDSKNNGEELNRQRVMRGLNELYLIVVPMLSAKDHKPISDTRIRMGEIDHAGNLVMPEALRYDLARPLGRVLSGVTRTGPGPVREVVTVGDLTTKAFLDAGITPRLMIVDNHVNRRVYTRLQPIITKRKFDRVHVVSGPGFISREAREAIREVFSREHDAPTPIVVEVEGEEDLLALPVIEYAPLGWSVYYGQPKTPNRAGKESVSGIVEVIVTELKRKEARDYLKQFI